MDAERGGEEGASGEIEKLALREREKMEKGR